MRKILFFDLETTGGLSSGRIIANNKISVNPIL